jgi:hypothetical protein
MLRTTTITRSNKEPLGTITIYRTTLKPLSITCVQRKAQRNKRKRPLRSEAKPIITAISSVKTDGPVSPRKNYFARDFIS